MMNQGKDKSQLCEQKRDPEGGKLSKEKCPYGEFLGHKNKYLLT